MVSKALPMLRTPPSTSPATPNSAACPRRKSRRRWAFRRPTSKACSSACKDHRRAAVVSGSGWRLTPIGDERWPTCRCGTWRASSTPTPRHRAPTKAHRLRARSRLKPSWRSCRKPRRMPTRHRAAPRARTRRASASVAPKAAAASSSNPGAARCFRRARELGVSVVGLRAGRQPRLNCGPRPPHLRWPL